MIDRRKLGNLVGIENDRGLRKAHRSWIESELKNGKSFRDGIWTESIATGSNAFVEIAKQKVNLLPQSGRPQEAPPPPRGA